MIYSAELSRPLQPKSPIAFENIQGTANTKLLGKPLAHSNVHTVLVKLYTRMNNTGCALADNRVDAHGETDQDAEEYGIKHTGIVDVEGMVTIEKTHPVFCPQGGPYAA